jgi:hypothetical protein
MAHARLISCTDDLCSFEVKSERGQKEAWLCGDRSELGAPVPCDEDKKQTINYIVTQLDRGRRHNCTEHFMALDVKFYAKEILDDVNKWDSEDEKKEALYSSRPFGIGLG